MGKRWPHKLKRFGPGEMPGIILCVQAVTEQAYQSDADAWGYPKFAGWAGCVMVRNATGYKTGATQTGDTAADFWQWVKLNKRCDGATWLVSIGAREQAAIFGLWDLIMAREASVCGADPWTRLGDETAKGKGQTGFVILEDPPTIVHFSLADCVGSFTWVDPANYGANNLQSMAEARYDEYATPLSGKAVNLSIHDRLSFQVEVANEWIDTYTDALSALMLGGLEHTAASQAMAGFRRRYMRDDITIHDNVATLKLERAGLYGGRCECKFVGTVFGDGETGVRLQDDELPAGWTTTEGPVYHLDVNSLYPSVAVSARLPTKLISSNNGVPVLTLARAATKIACVARVLVETRFPVVPLRMDRGIVYPVGKFWTTICGPEIRLALDIGTIHECTRFAGYESAVIYGDWVRDLYDAKLRAYRAGNHAMGECYKRILNASFGKWAQRSRRWVSKPDELCMLPFSQWWQVNDETGTAEQWRSFAWAVERCEDAGEPSESMPIITATIHSLARVRLWNLLEICGPRNAYYCDTDSIWCNENGYKNLLAFGEIDSEALGKMRVVAKHRVVTWWGQKRYRADGKLTLAGAPLGAAVTGDAFAVTMRADPLQSYLFRDQPPGTDKHVARVRLNLPYTVGKVSPSGEVFPLQVLDSEDVG